MKGIVSLSFKSFSAFLVLCVVSFTSCKEINLKSDIVGKWSYDYVGKTNTTVQGQYGSYIFKKHGKVTCIKGEVYEYTMVPSYKNNKETEYTGRWSLHNEDIEIVYSKSVETITKQNEGMSEEIVETNTSEEEVRETLVVHKEKGEMILILPGVGSVYKE